MEEAATELRGRVESPQNQLDETLNDANFIEAATKARPDVDRLHTEWDAARALPYDC